MCGFIQTTSLVGGFYEVINQRITGVYGMALAVIVINPAFHG